MCICALLLVLLVVCASLSFVNSPHAHFGRLTWYCWRVDTVWCTVLVSLLSVSQFAPADRYAVVFVLHSHVWIKQRCLHRRRRHCCCCHCHARHRIRYLVVCLKQKRINWMKKKNWNVCSTSINSRTQSNTHPLIHTCTHAHTEYGGIGK